MRVRRRELRRSLNKHRGHNIKHHHDGKFSAVECKDCRELMLVDLIHEGETNVQEEK